MGEFEPELPATADASRKYCGVTKSKSWKGGPMFFAAVMAGKAYVSDRLFPPVGMSGDGKDGFSNRKQRMPGNSCCNFRTRDEALLAELSGLTKGRSREI